MLCNKRPRPGPPTLKPHDKAYPLELRLGSWEPHLSAKKIPLSKRQSPGISGWENIANLDDFSGIVIESDEEQK